MHSNITWWHSPLQTVTLHENATSTSEFPSKFVGANALNAAINAPRVSLEKLGNKSSFFEHLLEKKKQRTFTWMSFPHIILTQCRLLIHVNNDSVCLKKTVNLAGAWN